MPNKLRTARDDRSVKLSITVKARLERKYDVAALKKIDAAVERWIKADAKRGIHTIHVAVDNPREMKKRGVRPISGEATASKIKRAVDDLCKRLTPEYLVIFGANDVVPMFEVTNPEYDPHHPKMGHDKTVKTDNPYASFLPFVSGDLHSYLVPDRIIGRIPDMVWDPTESQNCNPAWIIDYLETAISWTSKPSNFYTNTFAICAEQWKAAAEQCMQYITRPVSDLFVSPRTNDGWISTRKRLSSRLHMIKCHGSPGQATFYGHPQQVSQTPVDAGPSKIGREKEFTPAVTSATLKSRLRPATIVATVCCYSAQVFSDPDKWPIASTYLRRGALGFVGSAGQTSNNPLNMRWADRIATDYLKNVLGGSSIGRAFLDAKQLYLSRFIFGKHPYGLDRADEKTLIEYVLLGDPSIHAVVTEPLPTPALAAEDRRLRRVSRQLAGWRVRQMLPKRERANPAARAMAKNVFRKVRSTLTKDVIKELKDYGIKPSEVRVEKLITRIHVPKEACGGPTVTKSRHSLEYYWTGCRPVGDGDEQIRVIRAETDLKGRLWHTSVSTSS